MKCLRQLTAAILLCVGTASAAEISDEKKALIDELIEVNGGKFIGEDLAFARAQEIRKLAELTGTEVDEAFFEIMTSVMSEVVFEEYVESGVVQQVAYDSFGSRFETNELRQLLTFYKTPVGSKLLRVMPEISALSIESLRELDEKVTPIFTERMIERLRKLDINTVESINSSVIKSLDQIRLPLADNQPEQSNQHEQEIVRLIEEKCADAPASDEILPVYRGSPTYPRAAAIHGVEGWVDVRYTINPDGHTSDVSVYDYTTGSLFHEAAIAAVSRYRFCPIDTPKVNEIRVRFEMEGRQDTDVTASTAAPSIGSSKLAFVESENFSDIVEAYTSAKYRKAMAYFSDGGDTWEVSWSDRQITEERAIEAVLERCERRRLSRGIMSGCKLLFVGHRLDEALNKNASLRELERSIQQGEIEPLSSFEKTIDEYLQRPNFKAVALAEGEKGAYITRWVTGRSTQEIANHDAIENCTKERKAYITQDCELYMIGNYLLQDIPRLDAMEGVWEGTLNSSHISDSGEVQETSNIDFLFSNCQSLPSIWFRESESGGDFYKFERLFSVQSKAGNTVLTSVENGGEWVETQAWSFILREEGRADVVRARSVSNIELAESAENRAFSGLGTGAMTRMVNGCDEERFQNHWLNESP